MFVVDLISKKRFYKNELNTLIKTIDIINQDLNLQRVCRQIGRFGPESSQSLSALGTDVRKSNTRKF